MGWEEGKGGEGGGRRREGRGGERGEDVEGPGKWSAPGPVLALGGPGGRGRKEGGEGRAIKTPLLNGLATGLVGPQIQKILGAIGPLGANWGEGFGRIPPSRLFRPRNRDESSTFLRPIDFHQIWPQHVTYIYVSSKIFERDFCKFSI